MSESESESEIPIEKLYNAGKVLMPEYADKTATANNWLNAVLRNFDEQCALAGDPKLGKTLLEIGEVVYHELRQTAQSMNASALAVIATADDFVRTDAQARRHLAQLRDALDAQGKGPDTPTPQTPVAPDIKEGELAADGAPPAAGPPGEPRVASTPDPTDPADDRSQRDQTQHNAERDNPLPAQPTGDH